MAESTPRPSSWPIRHERRHAAMMHTNKILQEQLNSLHQKVDNHFSFLEHQLAHILQTIPILHCQQPDIIHVPKYVFTNVPLDGSTWTTAPPGLHSGLPPVQPTPSPTTSREPDVELSPSEPPKLDAEACDDDSLMPKTLHFVTHSADEDDDPQVKSTNPDGNVQCESAEQKQPETFDIFDLKADASTQCDEKETMHSYVQTWGLLKLLRKGRVNGKATQTSRTETTTTAAQTHGETIGSKETSDMLPNNTASLGDNSRDANDLLRQARAIADCIRDDARQLEKDEKNQERAELIRSSFDHIFAHACTAQLPPTRLTLQAIQIKYGDIHIRNAAWKKLCRTHYGGLSDTLTKPDVILDLAPIIQSLRMDAEHRG